MPKATETRRAPEWIERMLCCKDEPDVAIDGAPTEEEVASRVDEVMTNRAGTGAADLLDFVRLLLPCDEPRRFGDADERERVLANVAATLATRPIDCARVMEWARSRGADKLRQQAASVKKDVVDMSDAHLAATERELCTDIARADRSSASAYHPVSDDAYWSSVTLFRGLAWPDEVDEDAASVRAPRHTWTGQLLVPMGRIAEAPDRFYRCVNCLCQCEAPYRPCRCFCQTAAYCSQACANEDRCHSCISTFQEMRTIFGRINTKSNAVCLLSFGDGTLLPIHLLFALENMALPIVYPGLSARDVSFLYAHQNIAHEAVYTFRSGLGNSWQGVLSGENKHVDVRRQAIAFEMELDRAIRAKRKSHRPGA